MKLKKTDVNSSQLNIQEYWTCFMYEIANERRWDCKRSHCPNSCLPGCAKRARDAASDHADCRAGCEQSCWGSCSNTLRTEYCSTMAAYDGYVDKLAEYLPQPISDVSFDDVKNALVQIQAEFDYAEATVRTIQSCISIIFRFAESRGDAYNIMKYTTAKGKPKDILSLLISGKPKKAIREALRRERERYHHKTKSLTIWQMEKLGEILWDSIETDGRYCMIALMLYAGIRPAEGRALFWRDIVPFLDHPDRMILQLGKTRDKNGVLHNRMKTSNAFRRIPVHHELMRLLNKRLEFLKSQCPESSIQDMPICCYGNEFQQPCRDYEVAQLADKIFSQRLKLKQTDMYIYMLEAEAEKLSGEASVADRDQQLTLYVLRRNFWTWLEALTNLTDFEKRYIMGHEMKLNGRDLRGQYNDENLLWDICRKMDRCVISRRLHEESLYVKLERSVPAMVDNRGICRIHLTKEMLKEGGELYIHATTEEAGEAIKLTSLSALRQYGGLEPRVEVNLSPLKSGAPVGVNCEYENWQAHQSPASPARQTSLSMAAEPLSNKEI